MALSSVEKDRFVEVIFYLYFNTKEKNIISKKEFWEALKNICVLNGVDYFTIGKAMRILMVDENKPSDREIYYLLHKAGCSVRPIREISGIYWQKQKEYQAEFEEGKIPTVKNRILDVVAKRTIRDFLNAIYSVVGKILALDKDILSKYI